MDEILFLAESCMLHGRYHGLLPMTIDVRAIMHKASALVVDWTLEQQAEAHAWRGRMAPVGKDPPPPHVEALLGRVARDHREFVS